MWAAVAAPGRLAAAAPGLLVAGGAARCEGRGRRRRNSGRKGGRVKMQEKKETQQDILSLGFICDMDWALWALWLNEYL